MPFYRFFLGWEGSPTEIDCRKKEGKTRAGGLILTSAGGPSPLFRSTLKHQGFRTSRGFLPFFLHSYSFLAKAHVGDPLRKPPRFPLPARRKRPSGRGLGLRTPGLWARARAVGVDFLVGLLEKSGAIPIGFDGSKLGANFGSGKWNQGFVHLRSDSWWFHLDPYVTDSGVFWVAAHPNFLSVFFFNEGSGSFLTQIVHVQDWRSRRGWVPCCNCPLAPSVSQSV